MWLNDESSISSFPLQISHVITQCIVLPRQDPRTRNIAVLFRMQFLHPVHGVHKYYTQSLTFSLLLCASGQRIFSGYLSHPGKMVNALMKGACIIYETSVCMNAKLFSCFGT